MVGVLNVLHETLNPSSLFSSCIKKKVININTSIFLPKKNVIFNSLFIRLQFGSYFAIAELGEESCKVIMSLPRGLYKYFEIWIWSPLKIFISSLVLILVKFCESFGDRSVIIPGLDDLFWN